MRKILMHTLHPKMLRPESMSKAKGILRLNCVIEQKENIEVFLDQNQFINAFANLTKLDIVNRELNMHLDYSKKEITLEPGDMLFIPVIEDNSISYWLRIIVTNAMMRNE